MPEHSHEADTIDVHTHYVPHGWPDLRADAGPQAPWLRVESEADAMIMLGSREFRRIGAECWDASARLKDMDADGIGMQVVSPTPAFFHYGRSGAEAARIARIFNDLALDIVAPAPDHLVPFCQVPLQDPDAACRELERCLANGHRESRSATTSATTTWTARASSPSSSTAPCFRSRSSSTPGTWTTHPDCAAGWRSG